MKFIFWVGAIFWITFQSFAQQPNMPLALDSLSDDQVAVQCINLRDEAQLLLSKHTVKLEIFAKNRTNIEQELAALEQDTMPDKTRIKILNKQLKQARSEEKKQTKHRENVEKLYSYAVLLAQSDMELQRKDFFAMWKKFQNLNAAENIVTKSNAKSNRILGTGKKKSKNTEKSISETNGDTENSIEVPKKLGNKKRKKEGKTDESLPVDTAILVEKPVKHKNNRKTPKIADVDQLTDTISQAEKPIKQKKNKKEPESLVSDISMDTTESVKKMERRKKNKKENNFQQDTSTVSAEPAPKRLVSSAKKFKVYDPLNDVLLNPPVPSCTLVLNTRDDFSGEIRRATNRTELFRHTNPLLKNYMQGKTQVVCEASMSKTGPQVALHFHILVNDPNTRRAQGILPKNGNAILKFIDGSTYNLYNLQADEGKSDADGQIFTFEGLFSLDREAQRKLRSNELDKIRLHWANGYEDYEVHDIRLLMQQLKCLEIRE